MHRHSRARCKRKSKMLALKAFHKRVLEGRKEKVVKADKPKGRTFVRTREVVAADVAKYISPASRGFGNFFDYRHSFRLNQRQKRKRWAQTGQLSKK